MPKTDQNAPLQFHRDYQLAAAYNTPNIAPKSDADSLRDAWLLCDAIDGVVAEGCARPKAVPEDLATLYIDQNQVYIV